MSLALLKQQLAAHLAPAHPDRPGMSTGIAELDAVLPARGLPRGRLTELVGARGWGGGKATVARRIAASALGRGEWVAYIDATRTLAPRDWAHLGMHEGLWMVRPRDPARAAWCADVILRSGAFRLVVIDGAPVLPRALAVRLTHLARESDAALLVIAPDGADAQPRATLLGGALRLRVERMRRRRRSASAGTGRELRVLPADMEAAVPRAAEHAAATRRRRGTGEAEVLSRSTQQAAPGGHPSTLRITVEKGGSNQRIEVICAVGVARRLCTHPEVPDRRGVARRAERSAVGAAPAAVRRGGGSVDGAGAGGSPTPDAARGGPAGRGFTRARRCAESEYGRESGAARVVRGARGARSRPRARAG